jgi:NADPH:quinone reductase-like Zn-dependent oxidoreductase
MIGLLARLAAALVLSRFVGKKLVTFLARPNREDLTVMHELMKAGKVRPVIDKRYSLRDVPQAIRYLLEKHARGKVVIAVENSDKT